MKKFSRMWMLTAMGAVLVNYGVAKAQNDDVVAQAQNEAAMQLDSQGQAEANSVGLLASRTTPLPKLQKIKRYKVPQGNKVILVDDDRRQFKNAPFSYINNAIYAANPGDLIRVAPGVYREQISVTKKVWIEGAQAGVPATNTRRLAALDPTKESILVQAPTLLLLPQHYQTNVTLYADNVGLDGFAIQGFSTSRYNIGVTPYNRIETLIQNKVNPEEEQPTSVFDDVPISTFTVLNTRFEDLTEGVVPREQTRVHIEGCAFLGHRDGLQYKIEETTINGKPVTRFVEGVRPGVGVYGTDTLSNISVNFNAFLSNQTAGILLGSYENGKVPTPGVPVPPSIIGHLQGVTLGSNLFAPDAQQKSMGRGAHLINTEDVFMLQNVVRGGRLFGLGVDAALIGAKNYNPIVIVRNQVGGVSGSGIYITNSLVRSLVSKNTVAGNSGDGFFLPYIAGLINAFNQFTENKVVNNGGSGFNLYYSIGNNIQNNQIVGNYDGVTVNASQDNQVRGNSIAQSRRNGIYASDGPGFGASGNVFTGNKVNASARFDIEDLTRGDGTAGTDNIYRGNKIKTADLAALLKAR